MASTEKPGETNPTADEQANETVPVTSLPAVAKHEAAEEDEESDFEDLDDVLDDFNKPKQAAKPAADSSASSSKPSGAPSDTPQAALGVNNLDEEELMRQFEAEMMANLLGSSNGGSEKGKGKPSAATDTESGLPGISEKEIEELSKEMDKQGINIDDILKGILDLQGGEAGEQETAADAERATAAGGRGGGGGGGNFQDTIQETLKRMQESGDKATAAAANSDDVPDEVLEKFMKLLDAGVAGGDGGAEGLEEMFTGIIKDISNKEMLYEPMKDYHAKYGPWLEANKGKVTPEEFERYETQARIVKEIVEKFDEEGYSDENPECRAYIWEHMQQMEAAGSPPEEVISKQIMPNIGETLDNDQMPPECTPQ